MVVAWLVLGVVLLLFELHHLAFYVLFGAIGSFAAAAVAAFAPSAIALQAVVAVVLAAVGVVAVRPYVSRAFHLQRGGGHVARGVHGGLVGQEAVTLDVVGQAGRIGHVRLAGERWLAVSGSGRDIGPETPVIVTAVEGTTLWVWPAEGLPAGEGAPDGADGRTT